MFRLRAAFLLGAAVRRSNVPIRRYAKIPVAQLAQSFQPEISALEGHSTLLNQTNPSDLLQLIDVVAIIRIYNRLVDHGLGDLVIRQTCRALSRTAKDATYTLRTLPQTKRMAAQAALFRDLRRNCDVVAASLVEGKVAVDRSSVGTLLSAYEIVDPFAGVKFYRAIGEAAGSAIPCMVKSGVPLQEIKAAFDAETGGNAMSGHGRTTANMAWAFLRYSDTVPGALDEAIALKSTLLAHQDALQLSVYAFLIDAFVGDAPIDTALQTFHEHGDHIPHHAAMSRFLARAWETSQSVDEQVALFESYLRRVSAAPVSEMSIKPVTTEVLRNVVNGVQSPEEVLQYITRISANYDASVGSHTVLLNVMLTEIGERWSEVDEARSLVLAVLANYDDVADMSPVSFRVRLNSLERLTSVDKVIRALWSARTSSHMPPLAKLDWLSLVRATKGGQFFVEQWIRSGAPFERDIKRFCAARGFYL